MNGTTTILSCSDLNIQWGIYFKSSFALEVLGIYQKTISIVLILLYPFAVASILMTAVGFLLLHNWHNPSKIYYYSITISNLICLIFQDIIFGFVNLIGKVSTISWFSGLSIPFFIQPLADYSIITCSLIYFFRDIGPILEIWTTCLFGIHRMLIVAFPFKTHMFRKIFNKWTLCLTLIISGILYIPDFFIAQLLVGKFCLFNAMATASPFLIIYYGQLHWLSLIAPIIIICITIGVIIYHIVKSAKMRRHLNKIRTHAYHKNDFLERRSNLISMTIGFIYIVFISPLGILNIFISYLTTCEFWSYMLYNILLNVKDALIYNSVIIRLADGIVFFLMIPEFRRSILNVLRCHIPTYAAIR